MKLGHPTASSAGACADFRLAEGPFAVPKAHPAPRGLDEQSLCRLQKEVAVLERISEGLAFGSGNLQPQHSQNRLATPEPFSSLGEITALFDFSPPAQLVATPPNRLVQPLDELLRLGISPEACRRANFRHEVPQARRGLCNWLVRAAELGLSSGFVVRVLDQAMLHDELRRALYALEKIATLPLVSLNNRAHAAPSSKPLLVAQPDCSHQPKDAFWLSGVELADLLEMPSGIETLYALVLHYDMLRFFRLTPRELKDLAEHSDGDEVLDAAGRNCSDLGKMGFTVEQARALLFCSHAARKIALAVDSRDLFEARVLKPQQFVEMASLPSLGISGFIIQMQQLRYADLWASYSDQGH